MMKVAMVKVVAVVAAAFIIVTFSVGAVVVGASAPGGAPRQTAVATEKPARAGVAPAATGAAALAEPAHVHGRVTFADKPDTPVPDAGVKGDPIDGDNWTRGTTTDKSGNFEIRGASSDMYLDVQTADHEFGAVVVAKSGDDEFAIRVVPTASAHGRLLDVGGKPMAKQEIWYAIRWWEPGPPPRDRSFHEVAGGRIATGEDGIFAAKGLVPGKEYTFSTVVPTERGVRTVYTLAKTTPDLAKTIDLGDVSVHPATGPATRPGTKGR